MLAQSGTPANDDCENCEQITVAAGGSTTVAGSTIGATSEAIAPFCDTSIQAPGVWYGVTGTGNTMTASTCNPATDYDTKILVYCGGCETPKCIGGNDDLGCNDGFESEVSWATLAGAEYKILVSGFGGETGEFGLTVSDDDTLSTGAVACDEDEDRDGVLDFSDLCPNTAIPEGLPKGGGQLGVNRWALTDGDTTFDTTAPPGGGHGPSVSFSTEDTGGCSCEQILSGLGIAGQGHEFFGCTKDIMMTWVEQAGKP